MGFPSHMPHLTAIAQFGQDIRIINFHKQFFFWFLMFFFTIDVIVFIESHTLWIWEYGTHSLSKSTPRDSRVAFCGQIPSMVRVKQKNYKISIKLKCGLWYGLWKFSWPFPIFLRSMIHKKSCGMQKSYMWVVFHPYHKPNQNPHSNSLWFE